MGQGDKKPYQPCWRCAGTGRVRDTYTDYTGREVYSFCACGGCNGTGNELFMLCEPATNDNQAKG